MAKRDLFEGFAKLRVEISEDTRTRQLAEITDAVRTAPPVRAPQRLGFRRRWAVAIASLTAIVAPVGTAVAAEGALPGELLYPMKQISEQVRAVFDDDLPARHRVEELEELVAGDADRAVIADAQERAEAAVGALDQPGELAGRLEQVRRQVRVRFADDPAFEPAGGSDSGDPGDGPGTTGVPGAGDGAGSGGDGPGPGDPSGDPDQDRNRNQDGSGTGDTTPSTTTAPGGGDGSGGGGSGNGDAGGDGGGSGGGGGGSDGAPGSGDGGGGDAGSGGGTGSGAGGASGTP